MSQFQAIEIQSNTKQHWKQMERFQFNLNFDPIYGDFARSYYPAVYGKKYKDTSFLVYQQGAPIAVVECDITQGILGRFKMPLQIQILSEYEQTPIIQQLSRFIFSNLNSIAKANHCARIWVEESITDNEVSFIGKEALKYKANSKLAIRLLVDLAKPYDQIYSQVRKSYKSLINWGRKNISIEYVNCQNVNRDLFESFRLFHLNVAGKQTRPIASWEVMFEMLENGFGELSLGYDKANRLVSSALIMDGDQVSAYVSAVYDREHFDKPLAHWLLFDAIIRSKERMKKWFYLGMLDNDSKSSQKEYNISNFKKGFATNLKAFYHWSWMPR